MVTEVYKCSAFRMKGFNLFISVLVMSRHVMQTNNLVNCI